MPISKRPKRKRFGEITGEPKWITTEAAVHFHDIAISFHGRPGFPFPGYLSSALHAPQQFFHYTDGGFDLFDLAAVYLFHVAKAHAFTDGNKRTGYITAVVFLGINEVDVAPIADNVIALAQATVDVETGKINKSEVAALLRRMARSSRESRQRPPRHLQVIPEKYRRGGPHFGNR